MNREFPVDLADRCVKCGLCAPHCPTYALSRMEPEAPRGRIAIMSAVAQGEIDYTATGRQHLDHCLSCQACEAVCPADVPYLQILDAHRATTARPMGPLQRSVQALPPSRHLRPLLRLVLKLAGRLRPLLLRSALAVGLQRLGRWLSLAPSNVAWRLPRRASAAHAQVLAGCLGDLANANAIRALQRCARALELNLDWLPAGHCCGALAEHHGLAARSTALRQRLNAARARQLPLVSLDSACANQLRGADHEVLELCDYLLRQDLTTLRLRPLDATALIHEPCSHRNGLRERDAARRLLAYIPGLRIETLNDPLCCGAAGTHMLDEPERADALLAPKLEQAVTGRADYLVTTNVGCALHFAGGLRRAGLQQPARMPTVMHPVELLARQIDD